jgi:hypothetical protein
MFKIQQVIDSLSLGGVIDGVNSGDVFHNFIKKFNGFIAPCSLEDLNQLSEEKKLVLLRHLDATSSIVVEHLPEFTDTVSYPKLCEAFHAATGCKVEDLPVSPKSIADPFIELYYAIIMHPDCPDEALISGSNFNRFVFSKKTEESQRYLDRYISAVNALPFAERFKIFLTCGIESNKFDLPIDDDFIFSLSNEGGKHDGLRNKYTLRLILCDYQLGEKVLLDRVSSGSYPASFIVKQKNLSFITLKKIAKDKNYVGCHPNWPVDKIIPIISSNANVAHNHTNAGLCRVSKNELLREVSSPTRSQSLTAMASAPGLPNEVYEAVLEKLIQNVNSQWNDPSVELSSSKTPLIGPAYSLYCLVRNEHLSSQILSFILDDLNNLTHKGLAAYFKKTAYSNNAMSTEMCVCELSALKELPLPLTGSNKELQTSLLQNKNMPPEIRLNYVDLNSNVTQQLIVKNILDGDVNLSAHELFDFYRRLKIDFHYVESMAQFIFPRIIASGDDDLLGKFLSVSTKPHLTATYANCIGYLYTCKALDLAMFRKINDTLSKVIAKAIKVSGGKLDLASNSAICRIYKLSVSADFICGVYAKIRDEFNISFDIEELSNGTSLPNQLAELVGQNISDFFIAQNLKVRLTNLEQKNAPVPELSKPRARCL